MLERASTCLESGGRQLLRAPKRCMHSRRMLHSTFWHHGASELSLPIWWAASSILGGESGDVDHGQEKRTPAATSRSRDGTLLDFLYPEKSLALLKRLSVTRVDALDSKRRHLHTPPVRKFSTAQRQPSHDESTVDPAVAREAKAELEQLLKDGPAVKELYKFLRIQPEGKQELAWQLYRAIPAAHLARGGHWTMRKELLEYLTINDEAAVPSRVLQLFKEIPASQRRPSSYRAAIIAYISLRMVGPAIQLLERVRPGKGFDTQHIGTDVILRRTVFDEQWDLSLRVFRLFLIQTPVVDKLPVATSIRFGNALPDLWRGVTEQDLDLQEYLQSFFDHVREFQHELTSTKEREEALSLFTTTFIPHVIDQVVHTHKADDRVVSRFCRQLFATLRSLNLQSAMTYEHAITRTLDLPRYSTSSDRQDLWLDDLYEHYRQFCSESKNTLIETKPSQNLLKKVIIHRSQHETLTRAQDVIKDLRTFYPNEHFPPGLLKHLIHLYAEHGQLQQVENYLNEYRTHCKDELDVKLVSALAFACARRADVTGAIFHFNRIQDEFGLEPDTGCWNILLLAYVRADDLDGALDCFNKALDAGVSPDEYTFGSLLDLCAERGDVEAFEALFSRSKQMGVSLTEDVRARSGYVQAFLNAGDPEGADAIAQGMLLSRQNGTLRGSLTHTWNLLIQYHALDRDIGRSRQRYKEMVDNNIKLDAWTYGSLMRALVEVKQSNAAFKILRKTMPENNLRADALHYAIVMTGFLREGGGQLDLALAAYEHMKQRDIQQTESSTESSILALGTSELSKMRKKRATDPVYHLKQAEAVLEEVLVGSVEGQLAHRQPSHSRFLDASNFGAIPQAYYGLLMSLYTQRGAYTVCMNLLKKAEQAAPNIENYNTPMTLIVASMNAHLKEGDFGQVARYWQLARASADKLTKTFRQVMRPRQAQSVSESILDPTVRESFEEASISANRRHMLFKASRLYIRSLLDPANPDREALQEAQRTMRDLLVDGYTVDNYAWNEFIATLAQRGRIVDAFRICEEYLMPQFPGWRYLYPNYIRKDQKGYQWMSLRHYEVRKSSTMPRYKTLVVLATEFGRVKRDERNGFGYDANAGGWTREVLEQAAPMTIRAIETMPRTNDKLQTAFFHNAQ